MYVCIWFTLRHFISIYCILSHSPFHSYCLCCRHIECLWLGFTIIYFWTLAIRIVVSAAADRVVQAFAVHTYIHSVFTCSLDCFYKFFLRKFVIVVFNSYQLFVLILSSSPQHSLFAFSCVCVWLQIHYLFAFALSCGYANMLLLDELLLRKLPPAFIVIIPIKLCIFVLCKHIQTTLAHS